MKAELRMWADHPFSGVGNISQVITKINKNVGEIAHILRQLEIAGWTVQYSEHDDGEILWTATKDFDTEDEAARECERWNPEQWGSLDIYDDDGTQNLW